MAHSVVFGIFSTKIQIETAVDEMKREGFRNADISVLFPYNAGTKDFAVEKGTKAPHDAAAGASSGAVIGSALGWLAGFGVLAIPELGPFIAAGPLMALLSDVSVGAAPGGRNEVLFGMGIPEYAASRYEGRLKGGCILLSVHANDSKWIQRAEKILEETGAEDIASTGKIESDDANTEKNRDLMSA